MRHLITLCSSLTAALIVLIVTSTPVLAGGWPQAAGSGYYKLGMQYVHGDTYHDRYGDNVPVPALTDITFTFYGEYGITDDITAFASLPLYRIISADGTLSDPDRSLSENGISDGEFGLRIGLLRGGGTALSGVVAVGLPLGHHDDPENNIRFGDGEFNQYAGLSFGYSLWPLPAYCAADVGVNIRHKGFTNELRYNVEAGYTFAERLLVIFRITGTQPFRDGDNAFQPGAFTGLYPNNQQYIAYGPEVAFKVNDNFGVSAGLQSGFAVQNALSAVAVTAGLYYTH